MASEPSRLREVGKRTSWVVARTIRIGIPGWFIARDLMFVNRWSLACAFRHRSSPYGLGLAERRLGRVLDSRPRAEFTPANGPRGPRRLFYGSSQGGLRASSHSGINQ